jgi:glyoxylase I family protein
MPSVAQPRLHHLAVTVTDLDASVAWYGSVFDVQPVMDVPHPGGVGKILAGRDQQLMIALHRHEANDRQQFAETRTGLDHAGFTVPTRQDLEQWQAHLESNGVLRADQADRPLTQSPIADEPYASVLVFRDPDNIQLELFAPAQPKEAGA